MRARARDAGPRPTASDGLLRLSLQAMRRQQFEHLCSALESDREVLRCGAPTRLLGYSEWAGGGGPRLSLGWDWHLSCEHGRGVLRRSGPPRSNVMLVDPQGRDVGWARNLLLLGSVVDALPWHDDTGLALARCTR